MRLIDADALRKAMYHKAFETNTDMQRWDSGCWIRYKMFENVIDNVPTIDAEPVVRCKDCKYYEEQDETIGTCLLTVSGANIKGYCSWAERKEE